MDSRRPPEVEWDLCVTKPLGGTLTITDRTRRVFIANWAHPKLAIVTQRPVKGLVLRISDETSTMGLIQLASDGSGIVWIPEVAAKFTLLDGCSAFINYQMESHIHVRNCRHLIVSAPTQNHYTSLIVEPSTKFPTRIELGDKVVVLPQRRRHGSRPLPFVYMAKPLPRKQRRRLPNEHPIIEDRIEVIRAAQAKFCTYCQEL